MFYSSKEQKQFTFSAEKGKWNTVILQEVDEKFELSNQSIFENIWNF